MERSDVKTNSPKYHHLGRASIGNDSKNQNGSSVFAWQPFRQQRHVCNIVQAVAAMIKLIPTPVHVIKAAWKLSAGGLFKGARGFVIAPLLRSAAALLSASGSVETIYVT